MHFPFVGPGFIVETPEVVASGLFALRILLYVVATVYVLSGFDDLFLDVAYWLRSIYVRLFARARHSALDEHALGMEPEKPIAIMIPAWDEAPVIGRMLENTEESLSYRNYKIFVGVYPNDPATQREVERVRQRYGNIEAVVCPHNGPTNKADCLNSIYQGILRSEGQLGEQFAIFTLDDSEDIVHPLTLKLFNYLVPKNHVVQLPVFALERELWNLTAGHYADEFADNHMKTLVTRGALAGSIPSAGVGCAFSRRAMEAMAQERNHCVFNTGSLTEDYEFTLQLSRLGFGGVFVKHPVERVLARRSFWSRKERSVRVREYVAVREHFPHRFRDSVRQKTRWIIGITLQGWEHAGWRGGFWTKYMLLRDRKGLLTSQANMWGYVALAAVCLVWLSTTLFPESYRYPPLVERGTLLWKLIFLSTVFLFVRIGQRFHSVLCVYGWTQACLSIPRLVWGNFINFFATIRALRIFFASKRNRKSIAWDKTDHVYPSESELRGFRRRLGDILVARGLITVRDLDEALREQQRSGGLLGNTLIAEGRLTEDDVLAALGEQLSIPIRDIDPYAIQGELVASVRPELLVQHSIYPVELKSDGTLVVASPRLLGRTELQSLAAQLARPVEYQLCTPSDVAFAIARSSNLITHATPKLGERLLAAGEITADQLREALKIQRRSYRRLGDILFQDGIVSGADLDAFLRDFPFDKNMRLGEYLISQGALTGEQLLQALDTQESELRSIGTVLVDMGAITETKLAEYVGSTGREAATTSGGAA